MRSLAITAVVILLVAVGGGYALWTWKTSLPVTIAPDGSQSSSSSDTNSAATLPKATLPSSPSSTVVPQTVFPDDATLKNTPEVSQTPPAPTGDEAFEVFARMFSERFGTYSNQSNYTNLELVLPMTTTPLHEQLFENMNNGRGHPGDTRVYRGVTTTAFGVTNIERDAQHNITRCDIVTQRRYEQVGKKPNVVREVLSVHVVTQGDMWFISDAQWIP